MTRAVGGAILMIAAALLVSCAGRKEDGAAVYQRLQCGACHGPGAAEPGAARPPAPHPISTPERVPPPLDFTGSRLRPDWIESFLRSGEPGLPPGEAKALRGYLAGLRDDVRVPPAAVPEGEVERGRRLYSDLQCGLCHRIGAEGETVAPELTRAGRLLRPYTAAVLRAPQKVWPTSQMPDLGLTDLQVADLTTYLGSLHGNRE